MFCAIFCLEFHSLFTAPGNANKIFTPCIFQESFLTPQEIIFDPYKRSFLTPGIYMGAVRKSHGPHGITWVSSHRKVIFHVKRAISHGNRRPMRISHVKVWPYPMGFTCERTSSHVTHMGWTLSHGERFYFPKDTFLMWKTITCEGSSFPSEIFSHGKCFPRVSIYSRRKVSCEIFCHAMQAKKGGFSLKNTYYYAIYSFNKSPCSTLAGQSWISNANPLHGHIFRTYHEYLSRVCSFPFPWWRNRYLT